MTVPTVPSAQLTDPESARRATEAASAAATVLPSATPLSTGMAQPGNEQIAAAFAAAVVTRLAGSSDQIAVLVAQDLVAALSSSPLPGLDLAAAVQPALDAAAAALGTSAENGREVALELVGAEMAGPFVAVPLIGSGFAAAVLVTQGALDAPAAPAAPAAFTPDPATQPVAAPLAPLTSAPVPAAAVARRGIEMLHGVDMELTVELGRTRMTVRELLAISPGDVLELDRAAGSPADLLVNGRLIARGEVVVVDEDFGLRITEIVESAAS